MNGFMRPDQVAIIKKQYPAGIRLCCDSMSDDPRPIAPGTLGTVIGVDDAGSIMMRWDNGRSLSLIPGVDKFHIVETITKYEMMTDEELINFISSHWDIKFVEEMAPAEAECYLDHSVKGWTQEEINEEVSEIQLSYYTEGCATRKELIQKCMEIGG